MPRLPRPLAALAVAAAALLAVACGGDGDGEDRARDLDGRELLERSARAAEDLDTFRARFEGTAEVEAGEAGADDGAFPGAALLGGPVELSGEGPVDRPGRASLDLRVEASGLPLQVNVTRVDDEVYLGALGQDFRLAVGAERASYLDVGELYPTLAGWVVDPRREGEEEVDGVTAVRVGGDLDPARAGAGLEPLLGEGVEPTGTVDAWIGAEDLTPRRVRIRAAGEGSGGRRARLDLTMELHDLGADVEITAPTGARTLRPEQLGSLFGG